MALKILHASGIHECSRDQNSHLYISLMDRPSDDPDVQEEIFNNAVRENIIFLLLFLLLNVSSYAIINRFRRKERDEYLQGDEEEATVYRIALWLCTFSLATSAGAALLTPISIISNEILLLYPDSYYIQWLNSDLIHGLWNLVFLFSNLSLFVLLPFAYLFTEAEGFYGSRKGLLSRAYETFVVLSLLAVLIFGMTYLLSLLLDSGPSSWYKMFSLWSFYLPFLYACVSFFGVIFLLVCTPVGFARLFTILGDLLVKPQFLKDAHEEYFTSRFEVAYLERRMKQEEVKNCTRRARAPVEWINHQNGVLSNGELQQELCKKQKEVQVLDRRRQASPLQRNLGYPLAMLLLVALTAIAALMMINNSLQLLIGIKALPQSSEQFTLGISSLSALGPIGASLEVVIVFYLTVTSIVGLYTLPGLRNLRPRHHITPMTHIIFNSAVLVILSSAIPLLSRTIGITDFDLLGNYGRIEWLGNFTIVFIYNLLFAGVTIFCLIHHFTAPIRRELLLCFKLFSEAVFTWLRSSPWFGSSLQHRPHSGSFRDD